MASKNENDNLLKFLEITNSRLESHGNKIWEEMKHFSWGLYVLLGAPFLLKRWTDNNYEINNWLIILPIFAILIAIIAILTIRKESKDFLDALVTVLSIEKRLNFHDEVKEKIPKRLVSKQHIKDFEQCLKKDEPLDDFIKSKQSGIFKLSLSARQLFIYYFQLLLIFGLFELFYFLFDP